MASCVVGSWRRGLSPRMGLARRLHPLCLSPRLGPLHGQGLET